MVHDQKEKGGVEVKKPKKERGLLWRRLQEQYDRALGRGLRGEIQGCRQLILQGCEEILEYGKCRIRLSLRDPDACEIIVSGRELVCLSYHPDAVVVQGRIQQITYCCEQKEEDVCASIM